jgi:uncharacterized damage-inducible protein DinB
MPDTLTIPDAVTAAIEFAESAKKRLLNTLEHVPDDKLNWKPSDTANSAIRIAAHAGLSNHHFATMIRGESFPDIPKEKLFEQIEAQEAAVTTRAQVVAIIEEKATEAIAALKALTPEQIASEVPTIFGPMSMGFIMTLVGRHMDDHAAQIDYLQTIWGDGDMHF